MAALDFPSSPSAGQIYTANGISYTYNGTYWKPNTTQVTTVGLPVLYEITTSGSPSTVTISSIPQIYRDLVLVVTGRSTVAAANTDLRLTVNGDVGTNYDFEQFHYYSSGIADAQSIGSTYANIGNLSAASDPANRVAACEIRIHNYSSAVVDKQIKSTWSVNIGTGTFTQGVGIYGSTWRPTTPTAITSLTLFPGSGNFADGTTITLYGIGGPTQVASSPATTIKSRAFLNTATNTTNVGWQKVPLDTVDFDTASIWNSTNKRFIPTQAGYYQCNLRSRTNTGALGALAVGKNGTQYFAVGTDTGAAQLGIGGSGLLYCNGTTDYLEMFVYTTSVVAYTVGGFDTWMSIYGPV